METMVRWFGVNGSLGIFALAAVAVVGGLRRIPWPKPKPRPVAPAQVVVVPGGDVYSEVVFPLLFGAVGLAVFVLLAWAVVKFVYLVVFVW